MRRELNGKEIADFVKNRHLRVSRSIKGLRGKRPKLVIVRTNPNPVTDLYLKIKQNYGRDIEAEVEIVNVNSENFEKVISLLNKDKAIDGIIVQLPLPEGFETDKVLNLVDPKKDVDGLTLDSKFEQPTPLAIDWLLAGYNIDLVGKKIVVVGQGRLVGGPLAKKWQAAGLNIQVVDETTKDLSGLLRDAEIIVSAAGSPGLITSDMVKDGVVVVDAGTATDSNGVVGDVSETVRQREDVTITPIKGGVGPLTVSALFENLLAAAQNNT